MAIFDEQDNIFSGSSGRGGFDKSAPDTQPYGYLDLFGAAGDAASSYADPSEQWSKKLDQYATNINAYEAIGGRDFYEDLKAFVGEDATKEVAAGLDVGTQSFWSKSVFGESSAPSAATATIGFGFSADLKRRVELYEEFFRQKSEDPEFAGLFLSNEQIEKRIKEKEQGYVNKLDAIRESIGGGVTPTVVEFISGMGEQAKDPENLATFFVGGGGGTIVKAMLMSAGENAAIELAQFLRVKEYQEMLDREYGASDLLMNVLTSGTMGGLLRGGAKALELRAKNKVLHQLKDDIALDMKKAGDDGLFTAMSIEADKQRIADFNIAREVGPDNFPSDHTRRILRAQDDIFSVTREKFDMTPSQVMQADLSKVNDAGKRAELAEFQELVRNKGFEGDVAPPRKEEFVPANEFQRAEIEGLAGEKVNREQALQKVQDVNFDEAKGLYQQRLRQSLEEMPELADPALKRMADDMGLEVNGIKEKLDTIDRLKQAVTKCSGR